MSSVTGAFVSAYPETPDAYPEVLALGPSVEFWPPGSALRPGDRLLGTKRSGDVYTSTDLTLLGGVADKVSGELERFAEAEIARQKEAMQKALRSYVPGSIAERVESAQDLSASEREVSILFADMRDYSGFSEVRSSEEISHRPSHGAFRDASG